MKLQQLSYFCEVCKFNNISRAAKHLYISPSAISMAVKDIVYPYRLRIHYLQKILERQSIYNHIVMSNNN